MKRLKIIIAVVMAIGILAACGCSVKEPGTDSAVGDQAIVSSIVHGSPSGVWFMLSTALAESLGNTYKGSVLHATPGNQTANIFRIDRYESEFALTHSNIAFAAMNGTWEYDEKISNIGGIAVFYPSVLQFAMRKQLGVGTFDEFIENKIPLKFAIGADGGIQQLVLIAVLREYGLTLEDLEGWGCKLHRVGSSESVELFSDGVIDGIWIPASAPNPSIMQMATNAEMSMVTLSSEIIERVIENAGYSHQDIPADSYGFVTESIPSVCGYTILCASLQTSDETAYKMARAINENIDYIKSVHSSMGGITSDKLIENIKIPLHPGAEKYYREIGLMD
ncbi:MAG: TAXI family TRAP transporter solute-binding subunit [Clostridia bacterium]